jgi:succinate-acetate transporter protein
MKKQIISVSGKTVFGMVLSALGIFMILYSRNFPSARSGGDVMTGPSFFPTIIGIILISFGIYTVIVDFISHKSAKENGENNPLSFFKSREFFNLLIFIVFSALYPAIITLIGFFLGTFLFCFILMKTLQAKWTSAIVSSLVIVGFTWVIFVKIAYISLPQGIIFTGW